MAATSLRIGIAAISSMLLSSSLLLAGERADLSPEADALSRLLLALKAAPDDEVVQIRFLHSFPDSRAEFERLFDREDFGELYDGSEYIFAVGKMSSDHPLLVGVILVEIAKESTWKADAFNYLQIQLSEFVANHAAVFVRTFGTLDANEQDRLLTFLADGTHLPRARFPKTLDALRAANASPIADRLATRQSELMEMRNQD